MGDVWAPLCFKVPDVFDGVLGDAMLHPSLNLAMADALSRPDAVKAFDSLRRLPVASSCGGAAQPTLQKKYGGTECLLSYVRVGGAATHETDIV